MYAQILVVNDVFRCLFEAIHCEIVGHFGPVSHLQLVIHILDDFTLLTIGWLEDHGYEWTTYLVATVFLWCDYTVVDRSSKDYNKQVDNLMSETSIKVSTLKVHCVDLLPL